MGKNVLKPYIFYDETAVNYQKIPQVIGLLPHKKYTEENLRNNTQNLIGITETDYSSLEDECMRVSRNDKIGKPITFRIGSSKYIAGTIYKITPGKQNHDPIAITFLQKTFRELKNLDNVFGINGKTKFDSSPMFINNEKVMDLVDANQAKVKSNNSETIIAPNCIIWFCMLLRFFKIRIKLKVREIYSEIDLVYRSFVPVEKYDKYFIYYHVKNISHINKTKKIKSWVQ